MLKEIRLQNWKSFQETRLYIDPITVLIGLNASGKSNALDALLFLQRSLTSRDLYTALRGENGHFAIRGGVEWAALRGSETFQLQVIIGTEDENIDYFYGIKLEISFVHHLPRVQVEEEYLALIDRRIKSNIPDNITKDLLLTKSISPDAPEFISVQPYSGRHGKRTPLLLPRHTSVLSQLRHHSSLSEEVIAGIKSVIKVIENIFILDPIPSSMRNYSKLDERIAPDGSNIAGVLATHASLSSDISHYTQHLPEQEISRVYTETVGLGNDAMLYCEEVFPNGERYIMDAGGLSDGTLRFIAILTAILTRPRGSLLVIEEIDNGIHPSRAKLMLEILQKEGAKNGVDVLVTSHNPAFLNELSPQYIPVIMLAYRNEKGYSQIKPIEDSEKLPFLMGKGSLGKIIGDENLYSLLKI